MDAPTHTRSPNGGSRLSGTAAAHVRKRAKKMGEATRLRFHRGGKQSEKIALALLCNRSFVCVWCGRRSCRFGFTG